MLGMPRDHKGQVAGVDPPHGRGTGEGVREAPLLPCRLCLLLCGKDLFHGWEGSVSRVGSAFETRVLVSV